MRLYRTYAAAQHGDGAFRMCEPHVKWSGSQADAAKTRKHYNSSLKIPRDDIHTDEVDVPTDKTGLLKFLNERGA
ncbi:MAG TPA: hypothetical protein PKZ27_02890 [Rhodocyclaceae bacterium]|nr:hypothetical protein [Burkholderiaceae bacterium]HRP74512.1 hypothetical protein [Rhodocyclaceae bacterium]